MRPRVAIVGSRKDSPYGGSVTSQLVSEPTVNSNITRPTSVDTDNHIKSGTSPVTSSY